MSSEISSNDEYDLAIRADLAVIKCWANFCAPCIEGAAAFDSMAHAYDVPFYTLDIESVFDFEHADRVTKLPTFFIARRGEIVYDIAGASNLLTMRAALDALSA